MQIKTKIVSCHTADSKPVKQEVNGTVIHPPLVFPGWSFSEAPLDGRLPELTINIRLCWKGLEGSLFYCLVSEEEEKSFITILLGGVKLDPQHRGWNAAAHRRAAAQQGQIL